MWPFSSDYPRQYKEEVEKLINELIDIGKREDFLSEHPGGPFDRYCRHARAREIGERILEIGGEDLMEKLVKKVTKKTDKTIGSHLESCWFRIGKF